ncbi:MAG TPA: ABC transporter permease [Segeticoccus sp.]|nr:ABC transporter permease [Segeticoccus sp.]
MSTSATTEPTGAPVDEEVDQRADVGDQVDHSSWRRLVIQPCCIAALFVGVVVYVKTADLSKLEQRTLNLGALWRHTVEHLELSFAATAVVLLVAIPVGVVLTRSWARAGTPFAVGFANVGQAAPSIGLLVLFAMWLEVGFWTVVVGLSVYGILPTLNNTITGLRQVEQRVVEAARGMGMSAVGTLLRVELPLAAPVILTGVRVSLVLIVGTASLGTFIGGGGLGGLITTGVNLGRDNILVVGAVMIAALALLIDWLGRVVEELVRPKGLA